MGYLNLVVLCCVFCVCFVSSAVLHDNLYRLDIIHYNDFHARFEETSVKFPVCTANDTSCIGGFARLYHEIKEFLKEKPKALLLNAGDSFQGTYWYTLLKWNITQKFLNLLPHDAHTVGNHEFDDDVVGLAPYLAALQAPVVVANLDASKEPLLKDLYKPHVIVERRGRKIGIIGLITPDTKKSSNTENIEFLDPIEAARKEALELTEKGVDIIILLSHLGLNIDKELAMKVGENIDIIVGGHTHSLLWNGEAPSKEYVSGAYPEIVEPKSKPGHKVLIVTASSFSKYVGNVTAYFDMSGELQSFDGTPVYLNRSIPEDPEVKALLQPYADELHKIVQEVVAYTNKDLIDFKCGSGECEIGDLVADAFWDAANEAYPSNHTMAFLLRSMIRGSISKGSINRGAVINILPFANNVTVAKIQGRHIMKAFEICLTNYWRKDPFIGPWMPQISGIQLKVNTTSGRVENIFLKDGDKLQPFDLDKEYDIVLLDFLLRPGGIFGMFHKNARDLRYLDKDATVVEKYLKKKSPVSPSLDNRLIVVH